MSRLAIVAAMVRRDWRIAVSYRASFVLELGSIVFFLALFFYLGRIVNEDRFAAGQDLEGDYFAFAALGIAVLQIVQRGLATFSRKIREEQTTGTFETLMAAPVSPAMIVLASAAYDLLRATASGLLILVAAVVVFGMGLDSDPGGVATAVLGLIGAVGLAAVLVVGVAALIVVLKRATALLGLAVTALALLGGVYFPVDVLPEPLETIAQALPFTWALDVIRDSLLGGEVDAAQLAGLFAAVAALLPLTLAGFTAAIRRARRTGTLAEY